MNEFPALVSDRKKIIDSYLKDIFTTENKYNKMLYQCMAYAVNAGGKRLRPIIIMLVWEMMNNKEYSDIIPIAASVEMVHTYSLIHDDLPAMDNDDLRRGKPTLHKKYNDGVAVLSGDALFSYALEIFLKSEVSAERKLEAMKYFLNRIGPEGIVAGQFVDTEIDRFSRDEETLKYIHNNKTAALISACFGLPGIISGASDSDFNLLNSIGMNAGLLFQIIDDILDVESDPGTLGKSVSKDIMQDKLTYITFYSVDNAKKEAREQYEKTMKLVRTLQYDYHMIEKLIEYFYTRIK